MATTISKLRQMMLRPSYGSWRALYLKVLRHTAEERAASMKRGGAFSSGGLDMATPVLDATDFPLQLSQYRCYRSQLTGLEVGCDVVIGQERDTSLLETFTNAG